MSSVWERSHYLSSFACSHWICSEYPNIRLAIEEILVAENEGGIETGLPPAEVGIVLALVLVGVLFLLNNLGITYIRTYNWWAVFILAPGLNMLAQAYSRYQDASRFTRGARRAGLLGFFLVALALSFLFDLSWALLGPAFLILAGLYLLFIR